jgi:hypothetical protein
MVCDLVKLRNAEIFMDILFASFEIDLGVKFTLKIEVFSMLQEWK